MSVNIGTYLGLVGAAGMVWLVAYKVKNKMKKEVKVYGEETIKRAESIAAAVGSNREDEGSDARVIDGEHAVENAEVDGGRDNFQDESSGADEPDSVDERGLGDDSKATEWDSITFPSTKRIY